jgi:hypothetical protein
LLNFAGCDSVATLHLIVNPNVTGQQTITICQGQLPYTWNGQNITAAGIIMQHWLVLRVVILLQPAFKYNPVVTGEETITVCEGQLPFTWNNQSITVAGCL